MLTIAIPLIVGKGRKKKEKIIALPLTKQDTENKVKLSFPLSHILGIKARMG